MTDYSVVDYGLWAIKRYLLLISIMLDAVPEGLPSEELKYGKQLPDWIRDSFDKVQSSSKKEFRRFYKKQIAMMEALKAIGIEFRSRDFYSRVPEHMAAVQGHIDACFHLELEQKLTITEASVPNYADYWQFGAEVNLADIPVSEAFPAREVPKRTGNRDFESYSDVPVEIPMKPFKFMKDYNLFRAW